MSEPAIAARALRISRGEHEILNDMTFQVERGTVTGLLGPSGAGKTTLIRAIVGVQQTAAGTISVLGHRPGSRHLRSRIGYATQEPAIYQDLTVTEALEYFATMLGCDESEVDGVIRAVNLDEHTHSVIARLSGGQKARANLAVALLGEPELLVLDEPTVGSDPHLRKDLWRLFHSMAANGATVLVSSHMLDEARRCEQLLLMRDGSVIAQDTPDNLRARTGTDDIEQAFLQLTRA